MSEITATVVSIQEFKKIIDSLPDPYEWYRKNGPGGTYKARLIEGTEVTDLPDLQLAIGISSIRKTTFREFEFEVVTPLKSREWQWTSTQYLIVK